MIIAYRLDCDSTVDFVFFTVVLNIGGLYGSLYILQLLCHLSVKGSFTRIQKQCLSHGTKVAIKKLGYELCTHQTKCELIYKQSVCLPVVFSLLLSCDYDTALLLRFKL